MDRDTGSKVKIHNVINILELIRTTKNTVMGNLLGAREAGIRDNTSTILKRVTAKCTGPMDRYSGVSGMKDFKLV
jgi:hypothetical protein